MRNIFSNRKLQLIYAKYIFVCNVVKAKPHHMRNGARIQLVALSDQANFAWHLQSLSVAMSHFFESMTFIMTLPTLLATESSSLTTALCH